MPTVLITGASRGLGLEFVRSYAADGWRVIATCRNPQTATELNASLGNISVHALDIVQPTQIQCLAAELASLPIDVLLNNAGTHGPRDATGTFGALDLEAWSDLMRVNAMAPLKITETFLAHVKASDQKKVVFISSRAGSIAERGSLPHHKTGGPYAYRSSKAALNAVAKALGFDLRAQGVTVVVLHPGWVRTETGGWDAPMETTATVTSMREIIRTAIPAENGTFRNFDGALIPW